MSSLWMQRIIIQTIMSLEKLMLSIKIPTPTSGLSDAGDYYCSKQCDFYQRQCSQWKVKIVQSVTHQLYITRLYVMSPQFHL